MERLVINELTRFMYDNSNEIITCNSTKSKEVKDIEKAIEKLKVQEKRLVDLYLSSTLDVETINHKNNVGCPPKPYIRNGDYYNEKKK